MSYNRVDLANLNFSDLFDKLKSKNINTEVCGEKPKINPQVTSANFVTSPSSENNNTAPEAEKQQSIDRKKYKKRDIFQ